MSEKVRRLHAEVSEWKELCAAHERVNADHIGTIATLTAERDAEARRRREVLAESAALEVDNERLRGELQLANISCATLNDQCVRLRAERNGADAACVLYKAEMARLREELEEAKDPHMSTLDLWAGQRAGKLQAQLAELREAAEAYMEAPSDEARGLRLRAVLAKVAR